MRHKFSAVLVTAAAVLAAMSYPGQASDTGEGAIVTITKVTDGDTVVAKTREGLLVKIRLRNIDAPEKSQAFGKVSARKLRELCLDKTVRVSQLGSDRYDRNIAQLHCDGVDANRAMVEAGLAWVYTQYNDDKTLPALQEEAKQNCVGLWKEGKVIEPVEFRLTKKKDHTAQVIELDTTRCRAKIDEQKVL